MKISGEVSRGIDSKHQDQKDNFFSEEFIEAELKPLKCWNEIKISDYWFLLDKTQEEKTPEEIVVDPS